MNEFKANRTSLVVYLGLLAGVLVLAAIVIKPYILSLIMGGILAHLSRPLYKKLQGDNKHSSFASITVTLGLVLAIMIPSLLMIALSFQEGISIAKRLATEDQYSFQSMSAHISRIPLVKKFVPDPQALEDQIQMGVKMIGQKSSTLILQWLSYTPAFLLQFVLTALACCFFLMDGNRFFQWLVKKIPLEKTIRESLTHTFKDTSASVIRATFLASSAQALIIFASFLILGVPTVVLATGATFLMAWIPMVGSSPVWIAASVYLLMKGSTYKVILMVMFGFSTGILDNMIRALVLKGRSRMHPLVSLVAIFGGVQMYGILGVFLGPIIAAILITLLEVWPRVGKQYGLIETFPGQVHVRAKPLPLPKNIHDKVS